MTSNSMTIRTIGHSNHSFAKFSELLRTTGVTAVADIRSAPLRIVGFVRNLTKNLYRARFELKESLMCFWD